MHCINQDGALLTEFSQLKVFQSDITLSKGELI